MIEPLLYGIVAVVMVSEVGVVLEMGEIDNDKIMLIKNINSLRIQTLVSYQIRHVT